MRRNQTKNYMNKRPMMLRSNHIIITWSTQAQSMADSSLAPSQWEMSLQSNAVSHWLGTNLESALQLYLCTVYKVLYHPGSSAGACLTINIYRDHKHLANDSTSFIWKLCGHWTKGFQLHHMTAIIHTPAEVKILVSNNLSVDVL